MLCVQGLNHRSRATPTHAHTVWLRSKYPDGPRFQCIGSTAHQALCDDLIVDGPGNLYCCVQVSQEIELVQLTQRHQRARVT
jgi:hypothetical protein